VRSLLHTPRTRKRSIAAATIAALALIGSFLVASPAQALSDTGTGGIFVPVAGSRIADNVMTGKQWTTVQVAGKGGVPADGSAGAVSVVATLIGISNQGILSGRPNADKPSTVMGIYGGENKQNTSFSAVLAVNSDGTIQVSAETNARLLLDVQGYYTSSADGTAAGGFVPMNGSRIVDTRNGTGAPKAPLTSGKTVDLQIGGVAGVPKDASAVIVNMIAANTGTTTGYFTPYPTGSTRPPNSFNYAGKGVATSMQAQVKLSSTGKLTVFNQDSTADLVLDIQGYFTAAGQGGAVFTPGAGRAYDTRTSGNTVMGKNETRSIQIAGTAGVPVMGSGINAVVLTLTSLKTTAGYGSATVWADSTARPNTTSINFDETTIRTNTITVPLGANGKIALSSVADPTDYVIDVQGWYANPSAPTISCASPFSAGAWVFDSQIAADGVNCTFSAPAASYSGQDLVVSANGLPQASVMLSESGITQFSYAFKDLVGRVTIEAAVDDTTTAYAFGVGAWDKQNVLPSLADGAVTDQDAVLMPMLADTILLPADAEISYSITDETSGATITRHSGNEPVVLGSEILAPGHAYRWSTSIAAASEWGSDAAVDSPSWHFRVAADGEAITEPQPSSEGGGFMVMAAPNGCTGVPDRWGRANFKPSCDKHDICYGKNSRTSRANCDLALRDNLVRACISGYGSKAVAIAFGCPNIAQAYYIGVRKLGKSHYVGKGSSA
jgi:hypothetical protein